VFKLGVVNGIIPIQQSQRQTFDDNLVTAGGHHRVGKLNGS
jgi:hypothetical protein